MTPREVAIRNQVLALARVDSGVSLEYPLLSVADALVLLGALDAERVRVNDLGAIIYAASERALEILKGTDAMGASVEVQTAAPTQEQST